MGVGVGGVCPLRGRRLGRAWLGWGVLLVLLGGGMLWVRLGRCGLVLFHISGFRAGLGLVYGQPSGGLSAMGGWRCRVGVKFRVYTYLYQSSVALLLLLPPYTMYVHRYILLYRRVLRDYFRDCVA